MVTKKSYVLQKFGEHSSFTIKSGIVILLGFYIFGITYYRRLVVVLRCVNWHAVRKNCERRFLFQY